ncbi:MAG: acyl transferase [Bacteroidia bacterium]|nr:acyl transferase [Bacteroidia bacterium]
MALELFRYQSTNILPYASYLNYLKTDINSINHYSQIPFLPVTVFKTHDVTEVGNETGFYFSSSGTTGQVTSKHFVPDKTIYEKSFLKCFELFYGAPDKYCILALLPSYLERSGSSLVYMADRLIKESHHPDSGFYLHNYEELRIKIHKLNEQRTPVFLLGVTYALLDLFNEPLAAGSNMIIMETGGMKGKRAELIKPELHHILKKQSGANVIHSEYGMTELLSQAYAVADGIFTTPPWMKVLIGDLHDPFSKVADESTGVIQVIDLANIHSCAFIATQDLGRNTSEGRFEIMGRMDHSEWRGCNLMVTE